MDTTRPHNESAEALLEKANAYYDGDENRGEAYRLYSRIVELEPGHAFAINRLANCYNNGIGVDEDENYAMVLYRKAAELGYSAAQYNLADSLKKRNDPECIDWYTKAFENGDSDAPFYLASIYLKGEIVPQNTALGIAYHEKAIEMGNRDSMLDLAVCLLRGEFVPQDKRRAAELMRRSAELGCAAAASNMVKLYRNGDGVEANLQTSLEWAFKAAELGDTDDLISIGFSLIHGSSPYAMDKAKALECYIFAGNHGSITGMENAGICYNKGYGTPVNKSEAIAWFEKAAHEGSEKGFNNLEDLYKEVYGDTTGSRYVALLKEVAEEGYYMAMVKLYDCYLNGKYVEKDVARAQAYLKDALDAEFPAACFARGCDLFDGECGVPMDKAEAVRLWTAAARQGHTSSAFNLGLCCRDGEGTAQDLDAAVYWLEKAAEDDHEKAMLNLADIYLPEDGGPKANYAKGIAWLEKAAELNNVDALFKLGICYISGDYGCPQDTGKSLAYWQRGSAAGHSGCSKNIGLCFKNGDGISQNIPEALRWFETAADQGSIDALLELGLAYDDDGLVAPDYAKAVDYYAKAYAAGSSHGAFFLATMYEAGNGVAKDNARAFELYRYAGEHGHARGMVKTGIFYHDGLGTQKNVTKAIECLEAAKAMGASDADNLLSLIYSKGYTEQDGVDPEKAFASNLKRAQDGDPDAQFLVYQAYYDGEGVEKDRALAHQWLNQAADNGHVVSQALMGFECYLNDDNAMAVVYWEKASAAGHLKAMHDLAELYLEGEDGVPVNKPRAIQLLQEAAGKGYKESQSTLGICYATGDGVPKDAYTAFSWFEKAAAQGDVHAQKNLGVSLRKGNGCAVDKQRAAEWFGKAAEQGNTQAQVCLADMFAEGEGIPSNYRKAEELYRKVLEKRGDEYYDSALFGLALLYSTKLHDHHKAFPLWREAAEREDDTAMYNLGLCYRKGWGVARDDEQALYWWRLAAAKGNDDAQHNINVVLRERAAANNSSSASSNSSGTSSGSIGCYVATAVYGSYDCPQVWTLRRFRDYRLAETWHGRLFIKLYYAVSPTVVKWFGHTKWFNGMWRGVLDNMVRKLRAAGYEDTPYSDRTY